MKSQFIEQVQLLMETQHIKYTECLFGKPNNYMWLCSKKPHMVYWMSTKDEIKIRNSLKKVTQDQEIKVLKLVLEYLDRNRNSSPSMVPEITIYYLNEIITCNCFKQAQEHASHKFSRMTSFRNSLRKLSIGKNNNLQVPSNDHHSKKRRSVTFDEKPTIYRISK